MTVEQAPHVTSHDTESLRERLNRAGAVFYHHRHPFNLLMHAGLLQRDDLQSWVANRYYYQTRIPIKDELILGKSTDDTFRQIWAQRLDDQNGREHDDAPSGLELWRRLADAVGLSRESLLARSYLLPSVKRACDDYVELVRASDLVTAVAASLTECFAAKLMKERVLAWRTHYPWVDSEALAYFERRITQARDDADFALNYVERHAVSEAQQQRCLDAFRMKCSILWRLLDAVYLERRKELCPQLAGRATLTHDADQRPLLLSPERGLQLNGIAEELLRLCDGRTLLHVSIARLANQYSVSTEQIEQDIASFLGELEQRRLVTFHEINHAH